MYRRFSSSTGGPGGGSAPNNQQDSLFNTVYQQEFEANSTIAKLANTLKLLKEREASLKAADLQKVERLEKDVKELEQQFSTLVFFDGDGK